MKLKDSDEWYQHNVLDLIDDERHSLFLKDQKQKLKSMYYLSKVNPEHYKLIRKPTSVILQVLTKQTDHIGSYYSWEDIERHDFKTREYISRTSW